MWETEQSKHSTTFPFQKALICLKCIQHKCTIMRQNKCTLMAQYLQPSQKRWTLMCTEEKQCQNKRLICGYWPEFVSSNNTYKHLIEIIVQYRACCREIIHTGCFWTVILGLSLWWDMEKVKTKKQKNSTHRWQYKLSNLQMLLVNRLK